MDPEKQPLGSASDNDEENPADIQISIKKLDGDTFYINISPSASVLGLKTIINDQQNVAENLQRLIYRAQELKDDFPLSQYGIQNGSTLHLVVRRNIQQNQGQVNVGVPELRSIHSSFTNSIYIISKLQTIHHIFSYYRKIATQSQLIT